MYEYNDNYLPSDDLDIKTPYDNLFEYRFKQRGLDYYKTNRIKKYYYDNNVCRCLIKGNEGNYDVTINFYISGNIKHAECECPYYLDHKVYCKHIYALILMYCNKENISCEEEKKSDDVTKEKRNDRKYFFELKEIVKSMTYIFENADDIYTNFKYKDEIKSCYDKLMNLKVDYIKYKNMTMDECNSSVVCDARFDLDDMETEFDGLIFDAEDILVEKNEYEHSLLQDTELIFTLNNDFTSKVNIKKVDSFMDKEFKSEDYEYDVVILDDYDN